MDAMVKPILSVIIAGARAVPLAKGLVEAEVQKEVDKIESDLLGDGDPMANVELPAKGSSNKEIIAMMTDLKAVENTSTGKKWCGIYHTLGASELTAVQAEAWSMFNNSNSLYPGVFPSIRKFEAEIVSMAVSLVNGQKTGAVVLLSSGGTESILIAMWGYREWARQRGIENPEVICSHTAHPAVDKACHYFGIKLVKLMARSTDHKLDPAEVKATLNSNTICIYASAPSFPHGVVDPVTELAAIAKERNIGCHVDNCLGGFYLSYLRRCGVFTEDFDFSVPGVTTMSIDVHKYGFASKGCSVVAFANNDIRRLTYIPTTDGTTLYITPTLQGSRSGATIASAWATLMHIGDEGYTEAFAEMDRIFKRVQHEVENNVDGIELLTSSTLAVVPLCASLDANGRPIYDIYALASRLSERGWNMFTACKPPCMSLCLGQQHDDAVIDLWLVELKEEIAYLKANPGTKPSGDAGVYGTADLLPGNILGEVMRSYVDVKMTVKAKA